MAVGAGMLQPLALSICHVSGSAVSVAPAGLGIREVVDAGMRPVIGLSAAAAYIAAAINRIIALLVTAPAAFILGLRVKTKTV